MKFLNFPIAKEIKAKVDKAASRKGKRLNYTRPTKREAEVEPTPVSTPMNNEEKVSRASANDSKKRRSLRGRYS